VNGERIRRHLTQMGTRQIAKSAGTQLVPGHPHQLQFFVWDGPHRFNDHPVIRGDEFPSLRCSRQEPGELIDVGKASDE
jgi:hypothetical protein